MLNKSFKIYFKKQSRLRLLFCFTSINFVNIKTKIIILKSIINLTLEAVHKYLKYISNECDRHLRDKKVSVSYDEINQLSIELERFINMVNESELSKETKSLINKLSFETDNKDIRKSWLKSIINSLLLNDESPTNISYYNIQKSRIEDLKKLKNDVSNLSLKLKIK